MHIKKRNTLRDEPGTVQVRINRRDSRTGAYLAGHAARCFTVYDVTVNELADLLVEAVARAVAAKAGQVEVVHGAPCYPNVGRRKVGP